MKHIKLQDVFMDVYTDLDYLIDLKCYSILNTIIGEQNYGTRHIHTLTHIYVLELKLDKHPLLL